MNMTHVDLNMLL